MKKTRILSLVFAIVIGVLLGVSFSAWYPQFRYSRWFNLIPQELEHTDYICVVVLSEQKNYIFHDKKLVAKYIVSTGSKDRYDSDRTLRQGVWRLGRRMEEGLAPLYGPRLIYLEYYNQIRKEFVQTQKAFHGTDEPYNLGKATSMGCVYHHNDVIVELYDMLPTGSLVITVEK